MSADNGTILKNNKDGSYTITDYDASSGVEYNEITFNDLESGLAVAQVRAEGTEYGLTLVGFETNPKRVTR